MVDYGNANCNGPRPLEAEPTSTTARIGISAKICIDSNQKCNQAHTWVAFADKMSSLQNRIGEAQLARPSPIYRPLFQLTVPTL